MRNGEKAKALNELVLRHYFFPLTAMDFGHEEKSSGESKPALLFKTQISLRWCCGIHMIIGPIGSLPWAIFWNVVFAVCFIIVSWAVMILMTLKSIFIVPFL